MAGTLNAPLMRKDVGGNPIPALGLDCANTETVSIVDGTAQSLSIPTGCKMFELSSLIPLYINLNGTATSTSHVFPAGVGTYKVLEGQTVVSCLRIVGTDTGPVTLTPLA